MEKITMMNDIKLHVRVPAGASKEEVLKALTEEVERKMGFESEDERIRKEIISAIRSGMVYDTDLIEVGRIFEIDKKVADRWLAYLEKQKEQKPAEYLDKKKVFAIMRKLHNLSFSPRIPINSDEFKKINEIVSDVRDLLDCPIEQNPTTALIHTVQRLASGSLYALLDVPNCPKEWDPNQPVQCFQVRRKEE